MRTPSVVSFAIGALAFLAVTITYFVKASGFWGGFFFPFVVSTVGVLTIEGRGRLRSWLVRRRLWEFGKNKFDSWEEFSEWLSLTPFYRLNQLAETPDDQWIPALGGGVINTKINDESKTGGE